VSVATKRHETAQNLPQDGHSGKAGERLWTEVSKTMISFVDYDKCQIPDWFLDAKSHKACVACIGLYTLQKKSEFFVRLHLVGEAQKRMEILGR